MSELLCLRCANYQKTCCQTCEIYVTRGDLERIQAHTGLNAQAFSHYEKPNDPSYHDQDDDPLWTQYVFNSDGSRRILKRKPTRDCTFLGDAGCVLPLEVRPLVCRLYPFSYTAKGLERDLSPGCPVGQLDPGENLLDNLKMHETEAMSWHRQLYTEIIREWDT